MIKMYWVKSPRWLQKLYSRLLWQLPAGRKTVYITFDDGPHPEVTTKVLQILDTYKVKATFFCIGKNVAAYPEIYKQLLLSGHVTGNHTHNHLNGWKTDTTSYLQDITNASAYIDSHLFRPPYGRISRKQIRQLRQTKPDISIVMWTLLSADFDTCLSAAECLNILKKYTTDGSIIVFHDSEKARERVLNCLPQYLQWLQSQGYTFGKL